MERATNFSEENIIDEPFYTGYPKTRLAVPDACGCDPTFTRGMYNQNLNPFDWGFTYSTDRYPKFYEKNAVPRLI
jgi:hypothetical protein